jgi:putative tryptophan/tyrosine transport system substrate-binding protein
VPIVFAIVPDPVGSGFVDSLARPGGNATGFMQYEYSLTGKWLELLKQIAPGVRRAAVLRVPANVSGIGQFAVIQSVAPSVGVEISAINLRDAGEIERAVTAFARSANGGLILTSSAMAVVHRELIIALADRMDRGMTRIRLCSSSAGCWVAWQITSIFYRRAATFVDKILKGSRPSDLPVEQPTRFELVINARTAKMLNLELPPTLLALADEVIE